MSKVLMKGMRVMGLFQIGKPKPKADQATEQATESQSNRPDGAEFSGHSDTDPAAHLDEIRLDGGAADMGPDDGPGPVSQPDRIDKDMFYLNLSGGLSVAGAMSGLKSLPIGSHEADKARAASDELYDAIAKTPWLSWMLSPQSDLMRSLMVIGAFVVPKGMAVAGELAARKPKPKPKAEGGGSDPDPLAGLPRVKAEGGAA